MDAEHGCNVSALLLSLLDSLAAQSHADPSLAVRWTAI